MATTTTIIMTTPTRYADDRHLALALEDLAAGRPSTAAGRALRITREELDQLLGRAPAAQPPTARPERCPHRCPCELGGLWRGVPRARRRHAVLCALWVPPPPPMP